MSHAKAIVFSAVAIMLIGDMVITQSISQYFAILTAMEIIAEQNSTTANDSLSTSASDYQFDCQHSDSRWYLESLLIALDILGSV